jgi:hypothetical protein
MFIYILIHWKLLVVVYRKDAHYSNIIYSFMGMVVTGIALVRIRKDH